MRQIVQPGPAQAEPIQWVEARGESFSFDLEAGLPLIEAVRRGFAARGYQSGVLSASDGALSPFAYVMPALSETPDHAAFYSPTFRPAGVTRLTSAAMTFGSRDDKPFFHCHALWREADERLNGGHILPEETVVAERCRVEAIGLDGAAFTAEPDPETNFKLFGPVARPAAGTAARQRVFAMRLRPNRDMAGLLEQFCRDHGIAKARLHGGVGSIIGACFDDGRIVEPFATEMAVRAGTIAPGADGELQAEIDVALVDYTGGLAEGRLARGQNPVLMTVEIVLEVV
ncbi:PCC domain-containing protein [Phreatobacter stygius]|uniref:DNA-binding protein n=1 Tax=Phreatobacter stygius TaxID=1940610 RepID=A0A4D7BFY6_9HYPH|nr:DUF296 domain-containing protein [Phreatobacter stygius]QCI66802.1 DNA-binding protein [Phreatobacter stygius]